MICEWMDDMWMDGWDGMVCGVVRPADGSVLELGYKVLVWILELDLVLNLVPKIRLG